MAKVSYTIENPTERDLSEFVRKSRAAFLSEADRQLSIEMSKALEWLEAGNKGTYPISVTISIGSIEIQDNEPEGENARASAQDVENGRIA